MPTRRDEGRGAAPSADTPSVAAAADATWGADARGLDLVGILSAVGETAYDWDLATDRLAWEGNAHEVLGCASAEIATGAAFAHRIAPEHVQRRRDVLAAAEPSGDAAGAPYRLHYRFQPGSVRSSGAIWVEEHGRWWPGANGRPARARGVLRVLADGYVEAQRELYRSDRDELTGQLNRTSLTSALRAMLSRRRPAALLMASISNLGVVNETFGFDVGDEVIAATARLLRARLRSGDTMGRYSANKFAILLDGCSGAVAMRAAAERFVTAVRERTVATRVCPVVATVSIGGVLLPDQATGAEEALDHALQALERARQKRFDCFTPYEPSATGARRRQRNIAIADEIVAALREDRMRLVLQPIVSAHTRLPALHEALLRLHRADGTIVPAGEFIVVAEQLGLSRLIDRRTLELAVGLLEGRPGLRLALNVSGLTAAPDRRLPQSDRAPDDRDHRDDGERGPRPDDRVRRQPEGARLPRRPRRFRRRLHVLQEPQAARRRHGQDRRHVRREPPARPERPRVHQDDGRARADLRAGDRGRVGRRRRDRGHPGELRHHLPARLPLRDAGAGVRIRCALRHRAGERPRRPLLALNGRKQTAGDGAAMC
jgi:diguanylate cyclase (GGDEF)-like protein